MNLTYCTLSAKCKNAVLFTNYDSDNATKKKKRTSRKRGDLKLFILKVHFTTISFEPKINFLSNLNPNGENGTRFLTETTTKKVKNIIRYSEKYYEYNHSECPQYVMIFLTL